MRILIRVRDPGLVTGTGPVGLTRPPAAAAVLPAGLGRSAVPALLEQAVTNVSRMTGRTAAGEARRRIRGSGRLDVGRRGHDRLFMSTEHERLVGRRRFLVRAGRGVLGVAVLGLSACSGSDDSAPPASTPATPSGSAPPAGTDGGEPTPAAGELAWSRVDLGFVAAYVLVRGREAAVVDTGVAGSADAIGAVLQKVGPGWAGVRHVVLTHKHPDHAGSIGDVLGRAPKATGYLGAADLSAVTAPRRLHALADGDEVFGMQIVGSPGHTVGHMAVYDPDTRVLLAGDALTNTDGLAGSNPAFTEDADAAKATVGKLARLRPGTILVGHGDPIRRDAADALTQLADSLG
jgi:glyoxylase-like metal-dependent hydrolase (beta-lactamase superfamily II)